MKTILISVGILVLIALGGLVWYFYPENVRTPDKSDRIVVMTPIKDSVVSSPLSVSGRARGQWYFEGSFPIVLRDEAGKTIAEGYVTAKGEWMSEDFVPFLGTLQFKGVTSGTKGTLVLKKDNPSGLPEYEEFIEVPVVFK